MRVLRMSAIVCAALACSGPAGSLAADADLYPTADASGISDYNNLMEALSAEPLGATAYIRCGLVDRPVGGYSGELVLEDGDAVTLEDATGATMTYEFDSDSVVTPGHIAVPIPGTDPRDIADTLVVAINDHAYDTGNPEGLRITAEVISSPGFYTAHVVMTQTTPGPAGNGRTVEIHAADPWFVGQSTFEGGASGEGGGVVRLAAGVFAISRRVSITRFDGRLQGAGAEATFIDAVIEDPDKIPGGGFGAAPDPYWGAVGYAMGTGHLLFSFPKNVTVERLTLRVPENMDEDGGYYGPADWGFYDSATSLNEFLLTVAGSLPGERPHVVIRDVGASGGRGDEWAGVRPEDGSNAPYGIFVALGDSLSDVDGGEGVVRVEDCAVDNVPWRSIALVNLNDASTGVIRHCTVTSGGCGPRLANVNGNVRLVGNTIDLNRGFPPHWGVGAIGVFGSVGVHAKHNRISGRSAIVIRDSDHGQFIENEFYQINPDFIFHGVRPAAAFMTYAGSESNVITANRYDQSGLAGFSDPTSPAGIVFLDEGTSGNVIRELRSAMDMNMCDMMLDLTDDSSTPEYDGSNEIASWDRLCGF